MIVKTNGRPMGKRRVNDSTRCKAYKVYNRNEWYLCLQETIIRDYGGLEVQITPTPY